MKKSLLLIVAALLATFAVNAKIIFTVEGPESSYNQIWLVNETSQTGFQCRVTVLNDDESIKKVYGLYTLKELNDKDSNTSKIEKGAKIGIEMPGDFPVETDYSIEYKDFPLFDVIIVHLFDKNREWK